MRRIAVVAGVLALAGVLVASVGAGTSAHAKGIATGGIASPSAKCKGGSVSAVVGGAHVCLKAGQKCKARYEPAYKKKGFHCANGRLQKAAAAKPQISIADVTAAEGNSGTTTFSFAVTLSSAATKTVSVTYATADGTATAPSDYAAANGTLTFKAGEKSKTIDVAVVGDTALEPDETFTVNLSSPVNATIAKGSATGTIQNDDHPPAKAGHYSGTTNQNEPISLDVASDGSSFSNLEFKINGSCTPGGVISLGDVPISVTGTFPINSDGSFSGNASGDGISFTISGTFTQTGSVSGTFRTDISVPYGGTTYQCTSGNTTFTAQAS